jgi:hypothetical protein
MEKWNRQIGRSIYKMVGNHCLWILSMCHLINIPNNILFIAISSYFALPLPEISTGKQMIKHMMEGGRGAATEDRRWASESGKHHLRVQQVRCNQFTHEYDLGWVT